MFSSVAQAEPLLNSILGPIEVQNRHLKRDSIDHREQILIIHQVDLSFHVGVRCMPYALFGHIRLGIRPPEIMIVIRRRSSGRGDP